MAAEISPDMTLVLLSLNINEYDLTLLVGLSTRCRPPITCVYGHQCKKTAHLVILWMDNGGPLPVGSS